MKVAVTGGAGMIGSHLVRKLLEQNMEVRVVDLLSRGHARNLEGLNIEFIKADLRDKEQCFNALKGVEQVYHLSAHMGGVEYIHGSDSFRPHRFAPLQDNIKQNNNVLEFCLENSIDKLFFPSTACVYPVSKQLEPNAPALKEEDAFPAECESTYGWSKLIFEIQCQSAYADHGLKVALCRFFNVYGTGEDLSYGSHVIPELIRKALRYPEEQFIVYGNGTQTRSFLYAEDCAEAVIEVMQRYAVADPLNIGTPSRVSISYLAELIVELVGKNIPITYNSEKPTGVIGRCPDMTKTFSKLRWRPRTSLREGLIKTIEWAKVEGLERLT